MGTADALQVDIPERQMEGRSPNNWTLRLEHEQQKHCALLFLNYFILVHARILPIPLCIYSIGSLHKGRRPYALVFKWIKVTSFSCT